MFGYGSFCLHLTVSPVDSWFYHFVNLSLSIKNSIVNNPKIVKRGLLLFIVEFAINWKGTSYICTVPIIFGSHIAKYQTIRLNNVSVDFVMKCCSISSLPANTVISLKPSSTCRLTLVFE